MPFQRPEDVLNTHFDALIHQGEAKAKLIESDPSLPASMALLFTIVRLLWTTLRPVAPSPEFRRDLEQRLIQEAERRRVQEALGFAPERRAISPLWLVPVATLGAASLVGAYAYWRRSRRAVSEEQLAAA
ncbi:MAG: hypothetical protein D6775_02990 [Caldilineae bacterium]|nr:MAG: hypothetical protein D6775_02990 [Caldilineae bacterium]